MILISYDSELNITGYKQGSKKLLERMLTDSSCLVDTFDISIPLACYVFDVATSSVVLRDNWEDIQRIEESSMLVSAHDLENRLSARKLEIKEQAQALYSQSVSYQDGTLWRGGQASASSIQGAIELAKAKGQTELTLRDAERAPRVYSITEAEQIALAIGSDYEAKFQAKEDALYALDQIDPEAEDALAQINAITLEVPSA